MNHSKKKPEAPRKPFFARFLEEQQLRETTGGQTLKFPSDWDDDDR